MLKYRCRYYDAALAEGSDDGIITMLSEHLPPEIQELYDSSHKEEDAAAMML
ncbi:MAG: hypothetical protein IJI14_20295 [Anaerolineaceae bacterium]|nr:hypothetical protein [Anaerolineaceae bacterium]